MAYLLEHPNPNAPGRGDGQYWGYRTRQAEVTIGVIHSAENVPDITGTDLGAERVANYFTQSIRPASYHDLVDTDSHVVCLPGDHVAFGSKHRRNDGVSFNNCGHHLSLATRAGSWGSVPDQWAAVLLENTAQVIAVRSIEHGFPFVLLSGDQAARGMMGWTTHAYLDPDRRSDPGLTDGELVDLLARAEEIAMGGIGFDIIDTWSPLVNEGQRKGTRPFWTVYANGHVEGHNGARMPFNQMPSPLNAPITGGAMISPVTLALVARGDEGYFELNLPSVPGVS